MVAFLSWLAKIFDTSILSDFLKLFTYNRVTPFLDWICPKHRRSYRKSLKTTVGDKIKFPLCTDSPPTCERSCQQNSPKSRPKVASNFRHTLHVIKKVADLFLSGEKIVCMRIQFRPKSRACANGTRRSCNFAY